MSKIAFTIAPGGGVKIDAMGFTGTACEAATAGYEALLVSGGDNTRELKPEWTEIQTGQQDHINV